MAHAIPWSSSELEEHCTALRSAQPSLPSTTWSPWAVRFPAAHRMLCFTWPCLQPFSALARRHYYWAFGLSHQLSFVERRQQLAHKHKHHPTIGLHACWRGCLMLEGCLMKWRMEQWRRTHGYLLPAHVHYPEREHYPSSQAVRCNVTRNSCHGTQCDMDATYVFQRMPEYILVLGKTSHLRECSNDEFIFVLLLRYPSMSSFIFVCYKIFELLLHFKLFIIN
jgi:hypothetical protein